MPLPSTALYTSLLAALAVGLAVNVIRLRKGRRVSLGTGDDPELECAIRAHANLVEHAPLALALVALYELNGGGAWVLHAGALSLVVGRCVHAYALVFRRGVGMSRVVGMALTFNAFAILIVANSLLALASL